MVNQASESTQESPSDMPAEISGLRMTRQRWEVYRLLLEQRDHPTANDVFMRVKDRLPNISLATVYNCLEALVQHGAIRQVNFERESSRFCPNLEEHGHFHDKRSGTIHDVTFKPGVQLADVLELPPGTLITDIEITLRGELPTAHS
ncbi:MAG: transcriptional repressor [Verrucomicrobia bacterium]|nr:MAG: transcriptional repressor [Verrucomicrobiota bacterium]TAE88391.1 MAG: transcriptional repressor [Verrucomicrobiota bacterium]TAF26845.1 MAG: transcriptional repressor [Verrucomicrobiota bacterium]TAF42103.1 MAG: transcriptional repressor [Verrucomicrobiota bacterium]